MSGEEIGRPTVFTDLVLQKLEEAFSIGASDIQACFVAGISPRALYYYQEQNPDFLQRKNALKEMTSFAAKKVVNSKIIEGDVDTAKWQLERRNKDEYGTKQTVDNQISGELSVRRLIENVSGHSAGLPEPRE